MKQSILVGPAKSIVEEREIPAVGRQDVLVKVHICGVCASELPTWRDGTGAPTALGHEVVGEVIEVGPEVTKFTPGMRVTGLLHQGFAQYAMAPENRVIAVPDGLEDEEALGEPLSCIVSGARRTAVELGDTVAVVGTGFMGLQVCQMLRLKGPSSLIAIDVRDDALALAKRLGADAAIHPEELPENKKLLEMGQIGEGRGFDVVVEASGNQAALNLAGEIVREHGVLSIVGYHQNGPRQVDMKMWNWKAITVINAHERRPDYQMDCMRRGLALIDKGMMDMSELVSNRFSLEEVDEAFSALQNKPENFVKAIVVVDSAGA